MSILSERLRQLRGPTSQAEMARQLGMQRPQWIRYENGTTVPGADILAQICRVHAVSSDWLLGLDTPERAVIANGANSIALSGCNQTVTVGKSSDCDKCPYKAKLKAVSVILKDI